MATDFGSYLFESMTPEQQAQFLFSAQQEQAANGGSSYQAPFLAYANTGTQGGGLPASPYAKMSDPELRAIYNRAVQNGTWDPNMSFEQFRAGVKPYGSPGAYRTTSQDSQGWYDPNSPTGVQRASKDAITKNQFQTEALLRQLGQQAQSTNTNNQAAIDRMNALIDEQDPRNAAYVQKTRELADELGGYRNTANQGSLDALGAYTKELDALSARNDATVDFSRGVYDELKTPISIDSPERQAALGAQNNALSMLGGTANGALDYQSQAAQAYADPRYVAMRDQGLADLYDVSKGSKDVHVGQEDPKAYAAAMDALDKASALTNPAVTDQENFLYEKARQGWEMDQRALDAAKMSNLRRRGMAGGGAELTLGALGSQQIAQQRVLSDLAASAQAVARSQDMLKLQGQLGGQLNSEANALATGNANRQLQALGMYEQGSEAAQQSSFDQSYKRGVAADNASANNQQTRLSGQIAYGNQANTMRDDAYNDKLFEQAERDALWGRTTNQAGLELNASAQNANNSTNKFQGTTTVLNNNYVRDRDFVSAKDLANTRENQGQQTALNQRLGVQGAQIGVNNTNQAVQSGIVGAGINAGQFSLAQMLQNNQITLGGYEAEKARQDATIARNQAKEDADARGVLNTPILSPNGIIGLKGVPIL